MCVPRAASAAWRGILLSGPWFYKMFGSALCSCVPRDSGSTACTHGGLQSITSMRLLASCAARHVTRGLQGITGMRLLASCAARHVTRGLQGITGMRLLAPCAAQPVTPEHCMHTWRAPEYYRYAASSVMCCPACDSGALHVHMEGSRVCGF
ncbi:hypothetical protein NDU88_002013 [Pleurodeles waltl]|uniref:Uncharacterized protein n=1 Tax=Pleurodeles waltl TaxID=8319 RepID=A0AAV7QBQ9_PLEWA|nr:hypothetical protein NDU88_002013 [Pleurodeles waltl]